MAATTQADTDLMKQQVARLEELVNQAATIVRGCGDDVTGILAHSFAGSAATVYAQGIVAHADTMTALKNRMHATGEDIRQGAVRFAAVQEDNRASLVRHVNAFSSLNTSPASKA